MIAGHTRFGCAVEAVVCIIVWQVRAADTSKHEHASGLQQVPRDIPLTQVRHAHLLAANWGAYGGVISVSSW